MNKIKCTFKAPGQLCGHMLVKTGGGSGEFCSLLAGSCECQSIDIIKVDGYPNGEITFDPATKEYSVCITNYPKVAEAALKAYGEHYL
jgi:hypothetical protein